MVDLPQCTGRVCFPSEAFNLERGHHQCAIAYHMHWWQGRGSRRGRTETILTIVKYQRGPRVPFPNRNVRSFAWHHVDSDVL